MSSSEQTPTPNHGVCDPMDCSLTGSSVHGILQARILEWVVVPFSRDLPNLDRAVRLARPDSRGPAWARAPASSVSFGRVKMKRETTSPHLPCPDSCQFLLVSHLKPSSFPDLPRAPATASCVSLPCLHPEICSRSGVLGVPGSGSGRGHQTGSRLRPAVGSREELPEGPPLE